MMLLWLMCAKVAMVALAMEAMETMDAMEEEEDVVLEDHHCPKPNIPTCVQFSVPILRG
jgi:hypothetical protein